MNQQDDILSLTRFGSGDKSAFDELYHKYKGRILNYLFRMVNDSSLAEELTQETFIKVYLNIDQYRPFGSFSSWVYAIARNLAKNEFRRTDRRRTISMETPIAGHEDLTLKDVIASKQMNAQDIISEAETTAQVEKILNTIPAKYREVIVLCVIQGESYATAAEIIGCSKSVIAIRLFRARKYFNRSIAPLG